MRPSVASIGGGVLALLSSHAVAQVVSYTNTDDLTFFTGTATEAPEAGTGPPTGPYVTYTSKITITGANSGTVTTTFTDVSSESTITGTPTDATTTMVGNATETSSSSAPVNTQPCNGHVDFCSRKYSNVTVVGTHNSPFVRPGNSASNQELDVTVQLNDGVRFLQAQIQYPSNSTVPHFCHTSCDVLDAGPITDWLTKVAKWVDSHPYEVVTILLGNGNYSTPGEYEPYIRKSGILKYVYEAPYLPMALEDWPTLENMIIRGKRVVMFMDYNADQEKYPWLLDEFSQMWETPFDPLDRDFPCTVQRPPDLSDKDARNRLYLMNHNLNAEFNIFSIQLLVPAVSLLNDTNAVDGYGSLGLAANNCRSDWGRPPKVLNVDYYNYGNFPGSVFQVAAHVNNVSYDRDQCCGTVSGGEVVRAMSWTSLVAAGLAASWLL